MSTPSVSPTLSIIIASAVVCMLVLLVMLLWRRPFPRAVTGVLMFVFVAAAVAGAVAYHVGVKQMRQRLAAERDRRLEVLATEAAIRAAERMRVEVEAAIETGRERAAEQHRHDL